MAANTYATRSLLPWQDLTNPQPGLYSEFYRVELDTGAGASPLRLVLYQSRFSNWNWRIYSLTPFRALRAGKPAGYEYPKNAERQLMLALHKLLHPKK